MLQEEQNLLAQEQNQVLESTFITEIEIENAQNAEDTEYEKRHEIPMHNYQTMSLEALVKEFSRLLSEEKIQAIKEHTEAIKYEFEQKYQLLLEEKKQKFLAEGGNELEFSYSNPLQKTFLNLYAQYKKSKELYYKELKGQLQQNLEKKKIIISEIKKVIDQGATRLDYLGESFKKFKELKEEWYAIGAVPHENYNDLWNNFNHHCERFYDYLDLNKELREREFKHNLNEKQKIIAEAETLLNEVEIGKAFRRLQTLHRIWKEEIGPVERQYREEIWQKFSEITKKIHQKRELFFQEQELEFQKNAESKQKVIFFVKKISESPLKTHSEWQGAVEDVEKLRNLFLQIGKVPHQLNDKIWKDFNKALREFNQAKNEYYKSIKKEQQENLEKKLALIEKAKQYQFSEDWEVATQVMQEIQEEWKKIGFVSRKQSDKIWKEFKEICNEYFVRFNAYKEKERKEKEIAFEKKSAFLDEIKDFSLSGNVEEDLKSLQEITDKWESFGKISKKEKGINARFEKIICALYRKLNFDKLQIEKLRYTKRLEEIKNEPEAIFKEKIFAQKRVDELTSEILKLENNLQFFTTSNQKNALFKEAQKNVENRKELLEIWKEKLKEITKMN